MKNITIKLLFTVLLAAFSFTNLAQAEMVLKASHQWPGGVFAGRACPTAGTSLRPRPSACSAAWPTVSASFHSRENRRWSREQSPHFRTR